MSRQGRDPARRPARAVLAGALAGAAVAAASIELPTALGSGDRAEVYDSYVVLLPLGLLLGALIGWLVGAWAARRGR